MKLNSRRWVASSHLTISSAAFFTLAACGAATVEREAVSASGDHLVLEASSECDADCDDAESASSDGSHEVEHQERMAQVDVVPILQHSQVHSVILGHFSSINGCHTVEYSGKVDQTGRMTLAWVIEPDGSVTRARVLESSLRSADFKACVLAVFEGLRFPPSREGMEVGSWQIAFQDQ